MEGRESAGRGEREVSDGEKREEQERVGVEEEGKRG